MTSGLVKLSRSTIEAISSRRRLSGVAVFHLAEVPHWTFGVFKFLSRTSLGLQTFSGAEG